MNSKYIFGITFVLLTGFTIVFVHNQPISYEEDIELTSMQYYVTQLNGTEPAYANKYWNHKEPGIYVDVVSGEPLFSSTHKYKSGTGWPSFYKPLEKENIESYIDTQLGTQRVGIRSSSGSHLGHVFSDGPEPTGKRYCMNSAALRFVHKEALVEEGYEQYLDLFNET